MIRSSATILARVATSIASAGRWLAVCSLPTPLTWIRATLALSNQIPRVFDEMLRSLARRYTEYPPDLKSLIHAC